MSIHARLRARFPRRARAIHYLLCFLIAAASGDLPAQFTDVTQEAGVRFQHEDGRSYKKYFVETLGSGVALFDYDNDDDLDLYFVNGADLDRSDAQPAINRLYRNRGDGTFIDVTAESGVGDDGYGAGVCAGDYDNDGAVGTTDHAHPLVQRRC